MASQRKEDNTTIAELTKEVNAATAALSQEVILSNQEVAATAASLKEEVTSMKGAVYSLKEQQIRLEAVLATKKEAS